MTAVKFVVFVQFLAWLTAGVMALFGLADLSAAVTMSAVAGVASAVAPALAGLLLWWMGE